MNLQYISTYKQTDEVCDLIDLYFSWPLWLNVHEEMRFAHRSWHWPVLRSTRSRMKDYEFV